VKERIGGDLMSQLNAFDQHDPNYTAVRQLIFDHFHGEIDINVTVAQNDDMFSYSCFTVGGGPSAAWLTSARD
jgi:hypothetical protein